MNRRENQHNHVGLARAESTSLLAGQQDHSKASKLVRNQISHPDLDYPEQSFLHRANRGFQIAISKANPTQQQPTGNIIRLIMQLSAQCQRQIILFFVTEFSLWRYEFSIIQAVVLTLNAKPEHAESDQT